MTSIVEKIAIFSWAQWIILRLSGIELSPLEVQKRRYYPGKKIDFVETKLEEEKIKNQFQKASLLFEIEQKRRDTLTDKVKTLLSLGTFSLTFSVALFNLLNTPKNLSTLIVVLAVSITICILLCLSFLSINSYETPSFESDGDKCNEFEKFDINKESQLSKHIEELIHCCDYNHRGNDFLADVYRSAQRYFLLSLICIVFLLILLPLKDKDGSKNNTYIFNTGNASSKIIDEIYVEFDFDKYQITDTSSKTLISKLHKYKNGFDFSIVGYADKIGSNPYNDKLSLMRASSVAKWLVDSYNVPPKRVTLMAYGITKKFGGEPQIERNRRAVIHVLEEK